MNEAVHSFISQTYRGKKELVIVNDCNTIKLHIDNPEITIFNLDDRFKTLGEKINFAVENSKYEINMSWPDDDIQLPWAIETAMKCLDGNDFLGIQTFFRWYEIQDHLEWVTGKLAHGIMTYTKGLWRKVGKYAEISYGEDNAFIKRVKAFSGIRFEKLPFEDTYFICRRNSRTPQLTTHQNKYNKGYVYDIWPDRIKPPDKTIEVEIEPKWAQDYMAKIRDWEFWEKFLLEMDILVTKLKKDKQYLAKATGIFRKHGLNIL